MRWIRLQIQLATMMRIEKMLIFGKNLVLNVLLPEETINYMRI